MQRVTNLATPDARLVTPSQTAAASMAYGDRGSSFDGRLSPFGDAPSDGSCQCVCSNYGPDGRRIRPAQPVAGTSHLG